MVAKLGWRAAAAGVTMAVGLAACSAVKVPQANRTTRPTRITNHPTTTAPARPPNATPAGPYSWTRATSAALGIGGGTTATLASVVAPPTPTVEPVHSSEPAGTQPWIAAGTQSAAGGATTATVWTSTDALAWTATALTAPGVDSRALAATAWEQRVVVVGSVGQGRDERAAVWISPGPGQAFAQVATSLAFAPPGAGSGGAPAGGARMDVVAAGALGVFAAGSVDGTTALWYSTDGIHWTRDTGAQQVIDSANAAVVRALLVTPSGVLAAGSEHDGAFLAAALWGSPDGISWHAITAPQAFVGGGDHEIAGLAYLDPGYVAVGAVRTGSQWLPTSWVSPNTVSWSEPSESFPMSARARSPRIGGRVRAVTASSGHLVAVGGGPSGQRVWTSTDGLDWTEVALPAGAAGAGDWRADVVAAAGTTTVVADGDAGQPRLLTDTPAGWQEPSANPAVFGAVQAVATPTALVSAGGRLVLAVDVLQPGHALGQDSTSVDVLTSADGSTWTVAANGGTFAGRRVLSLASLAPPKGGAGTLAAVGSQSALTSTLGQGAPAAAAWSSPDAVTWTPAAAGSAFGGGTSGPAQARSVVALGQNLVAVGSVSSPAPSTATPTDTPPTSTPPTSSTATGSASTTVPGAAAATPTIRPSAVAWVSPDGHTWSAAAPLDGTPVAQPGRALGACANASKVIAVGEMSRSGPGRRARAWYSADAQHWTPAKVSPSPAPGDTQIMDGCVTTAAGGFVAYGEATSSSGANVAATWTSHDGGAWVLQAVPGFGPGDPRPLVDVAEQGSTWLAVGGPAGASESTLPGAGTGIWRSTDSGATWQRLSTADPVWQGSFTAAVDRVAFTGSDAVIAGCIDGELAVWVGTPTS